MKLNKITFHKYQQIFKIINSPRIYSLSSFHSLAGPSSNRYFSLHLGSRYLFYKNPLFFSRKSKILHPFSCHFRYLTNYQNSIWLQLRDKRKENYLTVYSVPINRFLLFSHITFSHSHKFRYFSINGIKARWKTKSVGQGFEICFSFHHEKFVLILFDWK